MLTVSVLGPLEVRDGDRVVPVPAGKTSDLLMRLALDAGRAVHAERLLDELWGDEAVDTTRNTLQSKVARLRRALGDPALVQHVDGGYRLAVEASSVDALTVLARLTEIAALVEAGDDESAAESCAATRRLFRGDALASVVDGGWAVAHRARLEHARLDLIETEGAARLRLGQLSVVIGDLEDGVASFPYQERLWVLLITALSRAGRQADALAAYRRVRLLLADELGLEPGPQLRRLETQVLTQDPALDAQFLDAASAEISRGNLPAVVIDLIGRDLELEAVRSLFAEPRVIAIIGPGGVGKTALALAVAQTAVAPGGVWLVRLESASSADEVTDGLIAALGTPGDLDTLLARLRTEDTAIILDNCEHVLDAAAELVQAIVDAAPRTRVLCTSQAPLGVDGEVLVELDPLALDDAVELFARRASAQRSNQLVEPVDATVRDLCRSLDGLPLAIELAAARTRTLSISEIGRRLDQRFDVLNDPSSRRPERRRALRATIAWSYELLFPDDQRGLWAIATFAGGADIAAVEHVVGALDVPAATAIDIVSRLENRSLLIVDADTDPHQPRYRLLESVRAFARDAMEAGGATELAHAAHADWFAGLAGRSTVGVRSRDQAEHLATARVERANIDAALTWCSVHDPSLAVSIAVGFGWAWVVLGDSRGAQRLISSLDAAGPAASIHDRIVGLLLAGWFEASIGKLAPARAHVDEAAGLARSIGDVELQARSAYYLAYVVSHDGDFRGAIELTDRSRALYADLDRGWDVIANELFATRAAISAGDESRALDSAELARQAVAVVDDPWMHVRYEAMLGELARLQRRFDDAVDHIGRAAATSHRLGFLQTEAYQVASLGRAQCQAGQYESGAATLATAVAKAEATGDLRMAALARVHLGRVQRALGDDDSARDSLERAVSWQRATGGGEQAVLGECLLAALDARTTPETAEPRLLDLLAQARAEDNVPAEVFALDALARLARSADDAVRARSLADLADERMAMASHFIAEPDRVDA